MRYSLNPHTSTRSMLLLALIDRPRKLEHKHLLTCPKPHVRTRAQIPTQAMKCQSAGISQNIMPGGHQSTQDWYPVLTWDRWDGGMDGEAHEEADT